MVAPTLASALRCAWHEGARCLRDSDSCSVWRLPRHVTYSSGTHPLVESRSVSTNRNNRLTSQTSTLCVHSWPLAPQVLRPCLRLSPSSTCTSSTPGPSSTLSRHGRASTGTAHRCSKTWHWQATWATATSHRCATRASLRSTEPWWCLCCCAQAWD